MNYSSEFHHKEFDNGKGNEESTINTESYVGNVDKYLPKIAQRLQSHRNYGRIRLLLDKLSSQAVHVIAELAAIVIQKCFRLYLAKKQLIILARKNEEEKELNRIKERVAIVICNEICDNICVSLCIRISIDCCTELQIESDKQNSVDSELQLNASILLREVVDESLQHIVSECIRELATIYIKKK